MADNFLERHYAEYESRKAAWKQGVSKRSPKPVAVVSFSSLYLPSDDFASSSLFYSRYFGFVATEPSVLSLPDGSFSFHLVSGEHQNPLSFQFRIASKYQLGLLVSKLKEDNILFNNENISISDPFGNIINIKM